jgi:hypothetical protein
MSAQSRDIFQNFPKFDNGLTGVNQTPGGDTSLDVHASGPRGVSDQSSAEFAPRAAQNEAAFREAQQFARGINDAGADGEAIGRGPDTFNRTGNIADANGWGPADIVAPEGDNLNRGGASFTTRDNAAGGQAVG